LTLRAKNGIIYNKDEVISMIWRGRSIREQIPLLRQVLPILIFLLVALYQMLLYLIGNRLGPLARYLGEILFYGLFGALVTWVILAWIERGLEEKERTERKMREGERYLASITSASAEAIISTDNQGIIQSWNRGAMLIFGYQPEEIIGQPLSRLIPLEIQASGELRGAEQKLLREGFVRDYETTLLTKEGKRVPVEFTRTLLIGEEGWPSGSSVIIRDITARKRKEQAIAEERARIARDMHDSIAQNLYFLGLKVELCRKLLQKDKEQERLEAELQLIRETLKQSLQEVRRAIFALHPIDLKQLGLLGALGKLAAEFQQQSQIRTRLLIQGEERALPADIEFVLFRVAQEALNNVGKHAQAQNVQIELDLRDPSRVGLALQDDGRGFKPELVLKENSLGIRSMRERVQQVGGTFWLSSAPGAGTHIKCSLPYNAKEAGDGRKGKDKDKDPCS